MTRADGSERGARLGAQHTAGRYRLETSGSPLLSLQALVSGLISQSSDGLGSKNWRPKGA